MNYNGTINIPSLGRRIAFRVAGAVRIAEPIPAPLTADHAAMIRRVIESWGQVRPDGSRVWSDATNVASRRYAGTDVFIHVAN